MLLLCKESVIYEEKSNIEGKWDIGGRSKLRDAVILKKGLIREGMSTIVVEGMEYY